MNPTINMLFLLVVQLSYGQLSYSSNIPDFFPISVAELTGITSKFGYRVHPISKKYKKHEGIDLAAPKGSAVHAAGSGRVHSLTSNGGYGNCLILSHSKHLKSLYAHLQKFNVKKGQKVHKGQLIGFVGNTGITTGYHLHFEISVLEEKVDPLLFWKVVIKTQKPIL